MAQDFSTRNAYQIAASLPRGAHLHFIGIGGSSMNGLARLALHAGYRVSGSDRTDSAELRRLADEGAEIRIGQKAENISSDTDLVVYTVAISEENPELCAARTAGIPILERGKYLGVLTQRHRFSIAVSGTHGKTTTTAMIGSVLLACGKDPAIHLGGCFPQIGGSVRPSDSDFFVTEACEYHAHMLNLQPYAAVMLNIEAEHLDYYKDLQDIKDAFTRFVRLCPEEGFTVACAENDSALEVLKKARCRKITYAFRASEKNADYEADSIREDPDGTSFDLFRKGTFVQTIRLSVIGRHNVLNALAALAVCDQFGCAEADMAEGLLKFTGTGRRFEKIGTVRGAALIDDYAHHPTEIAATLEAARKATPAGKVYAVFQAHTYSRALAFAEDFAAALQKADKIYVADIYAAREKDPGTISGASMADLFVQKGRNAHYVGGFTAIAETLSAEIRSGDTVISLGAGDVNQVLRQIH